MSGLESAVMQSTKRSQKAVEVLALAAQLTREVGGCRLTMCKSAKDRTSMSVTLEMARILEKRHGMPRRARLKVLEALRVGGVRRQNAAKNIGVPRFAFNKLQLEMLPQEYRPPPMVIGGRRIQT